jgi:clan AA aspartic protease
MQADIDTGFTDRLTLPPDIVEELGLPLRGSADVTLAEGSIETLPMYRVRILWHGQEHAIRAFAVCGDTLVGMALLFGSELRIRVIEGGTVEIEELP